MKPGENEMKPGENEMKPGENEMKPGENEMKPDENGRKTLWEDADLNRSLTQTPHTKSEEDSFGVSRTLWIWLSTNATR